jgi:hypothetical protein
MDEDEDEVCCCTAISALRGLATMILSLSRLGGSPIN